MLNESWSKSSHSGGTCCVEARWHKSSHSSANGDCVEVADGCGEVHVRDSKNPAGPSLAFSPAAWTGFLETLRAK